MTSRRRYRGEQLEPRILLSADLIGGAFDGSDLDPHNSSLISTFEQLNARFEEPPTALAPLTGDDLLVLSSSNEPLELVFIDTRVDGYETLVGDLTSDSDKDVVVFFIDDGFQQVSDILLTHQNVDAVHIISHGNSGNIYLGRDTLNTDSLAEHANDIGQWKDSLSESADILIYGCNLAANDSGKLLISEIADLTQADVAASVDLTGSPLVGANWVLEHSQGLIETPVIVSAAAQASFHASLLAPTTIGLTDVEVEQGASDSIITLDSRFSDAEDASSDLTYSILSNDNSDLVGTSIDQLAGTLTLSFEPGGFGSAEITIQAVDTDSESVTTTLTVSVNAGNELLFVTAGNTSISLDGFSRWTGRDEIVAIGGSNFDAGPSFEGTGFLEYRLGVTEKIVALHYVQTDITVGTANSIDLKVGDVLIALEGSASLTSNGLLSPASLTVERGDVFIARPDSQGDYSKVDFFMLFDGIAGDVQALSLAEEDVVVGDTYISAGTFILTDGDSNTVDAYVPGDLSDGSNSTTFRLLDGNDKRDTTGQKMFERSVRGLHLVTNSTDIGGITANSGDILFSFALSSNGVFGENGTLPNTTIAANQNDVVLANFSRTSVGDAPLKATPILFLDGDDIALTNAVESIEGIAFKAQAGPVTNAEPSGVADSFTIGDDKVLTVTSGDGVLSNDTDTDDDVLRAALISGPSNADSFILNNDGSFTYDHDGSGTGTDTFTYAVHDRKGGISTATATINIVLSNNVPSATNLTTLTNYNEDDAIVALDDIVVSDLDTADQITARLTLSDTSAGTLSVSGGASYNDNSGIWTVTGSIGNVNSALAEVSFIPTSNSSADLTISTHIEDQDGVGPGDGTISLIGSAVNDAPIAVDFAQFSIEEDSGVAQLDISNLFTDIDDTDLSFSISRVDNLDLLESISIDAGTLTLTPAENANGIASITLSAQDTTGASASTNVEVTLAPVNDAPIANEDSSSVSEDDVIDVSAAVSVLSNDVDVDDDQLSVLSVQNADGAVQPSQVLEGDAGGSFNVTSDGQFTFDPGTDFQQLSSGESTVTQITYTVVDQAGETTTAPLILTVIGANDTPIAATDLIDGGIFERINVAADEGVLSNDIDPDRADTLVVTAISNDLERVSAGQSIQGTAGGVFSIEADGSYRFDPNGEFTSLPFQREVITSVMYEVSDGQGGTAQQTLTVRVVGTSDSADPFDPSKFPALPTFDDDSEGDESDEDSDESAMQVPQDLTINIKEVSEDETDADDKGRVSRIGIESNLDENFDPNVGQKKGSGSNNETVTARKDAANLLGSTDALLLIGSPEYKNSLDDSRANADTMGNKVTELRGGTMTVTAGLSIGYVVWLIRSGVILSSVLAALPLWRFVDPLPILSSARGVDDDDESIEDIVQSGQEGEAQKDA